MGDMVEIIWNIEKERLLKANNLRNNISFTDCVIAIDEGRIIEDLPHATRPNQRILVLDIEDYAYVVPYVVEDNGNWFLKTVFPSRKYTALYLKR